MKNVARLGSLPTMTDDADEQAAREKLERERARVSELISGLRSEGLDEEEASQSGDVAGFDTNQEDQGAEMIERETDLAILVYEAQGSLEAVWRYGSLSPSSRALWKVTGS